MNGKIGLLFNGVWSQYALAAAPKYKSIYKLLYVHELSTPALAGLDALVIPFQSHQAAIADRQDLLYQFLAARKKGRRLWRQHSVMAGGSMGRSTSG